MKSIFTTTLRLNLQDKADRQAWEHLTHLDRRQFRSYSAAIVAALNAYFGGQHASADQQDELLRVLNRIAAALESTAAPPAPALPEPPVSENDDMDSIQSFLNAF